MASLAIREATNAATLEGIDPMYRKKLAWTALKQIGREVEGKVKSFDTTELSYTT